MKDKDHKSKTLERMTSKFWDSKFLNSKFWGNSCIILGSMMDASALGYFTEPDYESALTNGIMGTCAIIYGIISNHDKNKKSKEYQNNNSFIAHLPKEIMNDTGFKDGDKLKFYTKRGGFKIEKENQNV